MTSLHHLTDDELIRNLLNRDDLTDIEHELLDRLVRAITALEKRSGGRA